MDRSKDAVAARLAEAHFHVEPGIDQIIRLIAPGREADAGEPVKLLEINCETSSDGIVPIYFPSHPDSGVFYPCIIVEVRPDEFEAVKDGALPLPNGWELGQQYNRPAEVHA